MTNDELRQTWMAAVVPFMEEVGIDVPAHWDESEERWVIDCPFPARFDEEASGGCSTGADLMGGRDGALEGRGPMNDDYVERLQRGYRPRQAAPREPHARPEVEARLWPALRDVEDPEIPISVVGMGLIVSIAYREDERAVDLELTFTAMGCPAMDFIQDDIRERLLAEPDVDVVRIEVVWDPVWTRSRIREDARATMRGLGIVA